jgi:hypothetical protein
MAARGPEQTLFVTAPQGGFSPGEVEKFRASEEAKGNAVKEVAPGTLLVIPGGVPGRAVKGSTP